MKQMLQKDLTNQNNRFIEKGYPPWLYLLFIEENIIILHIFAYLLFLLAEYFQCDSKQKNNKETPKWKRICIV